jgi:Leucine-rich repeat (LRR) protein
MRFAAYLKASNNTLRMYQFRLWVTILGIIFYLNSHAAGIFGSDAVCASCSRQSDSLALVQLYQFAGGANWTNPWNLQAPLDTWPGVFLNPKGCVSFLNLRNNNLTGFLPNLNLPELVFMEFSENKLVGSVPNLEHMEVLQTVTLANNFFSGPIPIFKNKFQLRTLTLANNFLSGVIPRFEEAPNMRVLDLRRNNLTGNLHNFADNPNLEELYLNNNKLGGVFPNLPLNKLIILDASFNNFFGTLPMFQQLVNLEILNLSFNNFTGNLPNFPAMTKLVTLLLNDNNLFGTLPNLLNLSSLKERLWLQNNKFTGTIPNFPSLTQLEDINLNNNQIDSMPAMTNLISLRTLRVANNKLTFNDLLPSRQIPSSVFEYSPQASIGEDKVVFVEMGDSYQMEYTIDPNVASNVYFWYKDDVLYAQTNEPRLEINNVSFLDKGVYRMEATNPNLPALRIPSGKTTLQLAGTSLNDLCEFAYDLTDSIEICHEFSFFDVGLDVADASCGVAGDNVWFKFMARGPRALIYLNGSTYDRMRLALYQFGNSPCSPGAAEELQCGDLIDVDNLITGREYFISVVGEGSNQMHTFTLCFNNSSLSAPPDNDTPCGAIGVAPMVCSGGSTINATNDFVNPLCVQSSTNSVWFKTRLSTGMNSLKIDLSNNTFFNDVSLAVGTMDSCQGTFTPVPEGLYCERPGIFVIPDLQSDIEYYIHVSSTAIGSGSFLICLEENGRSARCADNIECLDGPAGPIDIPVFTRSLPSCYTGCTIDAPAGINFGDNSCYSFYYPTVWYKFTTDERADFLSLSIRSTNLSRPHFAIFKTTDCQEFEQVYCRIEGNYRADLVRAPIERNTTYYIAVSDFFGDSGFFDLCLSTFENTSVCNTDNELKVVSTSLGSPFEGPFQPGEEVTFCYQVRHWQYISCNWLQAIVPTFGPCWDPAYFDIVGQPRIVNQLPRPIAQGSWRWFVAGEARYNVNNLNMGLRINDAMPAGWYFINEGVVPPPVLTDPNTSLGDGVQCALDTLTWEICFTLRTQPFANCANVANCNIGIKTYTDGEIGARQRAACLGDVSTWFNTTMDCCRTPETFPIADVTICSGETIRVPLMANDTLADFNVNVLSAPAIEGAENVTISDTLIQTLTNTSDTLSAVIYQVISERDGCLGLPLTFRVTVFPSPGVDIFDDQTICLGDSATLRFQFTGLSPFEVRYTANQSNQPPLVTSTGEALRRVDPKVNTLYRVTEVIGANGCITRPEDSLQVIVEPTSRFQLDTVICQGASFWFEGREYTQSTRFEHLYENANQFGCDSTVDVNLTVGAVYRLTIDTSICAGEILAVGNNNFDKSGTYISVLPTELGCDSIITLNLTVPPPIGIDDTLIINDTDKGNGVISVNVVGGVEPYKYRWSNGRTTPLIQNLTGGTYGLTITDDIGCEKTFEFVVDNLNQTAETDIPGLSLEASPIPQSVQQPVWLQFSSDRPMRLQYTLLNVGGKVIQQGSLALPSGKYTEKLSAPSPPGVYWLRIQDEQGRGGHLKIVTY